MSSKSKDASASVLPILPDQLTPVITELCEVSFLAEFLYMSIQRAHETEHQLSFSFGEGEALISLMQSVATRISRTTGTLTDLKLGPGKEVTNHD